MPGARGRRHHIGALILPRFALLERWCEEKGLAWKAPPFIISEPEVLQLFQAEIDQLSADRAIGAFALVHEAWTLETGERTPSLKLRREVIQQRYAHRIDELFPEPS